MKGPRRERPKVRRFSPTEIAYHWAQALPWLACAATGIVLLAHGGGPAPEARDAAGRLHRYAGAGLVLGTLLVFLAGDRRVLLGNLKTALRWTRADFRWLLLSPLAALGVPVALPPPGRMNAGQKLNLLAQAMLLPVFAATGLAMWFLEGGLLAWYAHVAAFAVALPLVLGHLYLALVNPSTRRGLRGMIDGKVDREWAAHHHPLWIPEAEPRPPAPRRVPAVRLAALLVFVAAAAVLAGRIEADAELDLPTALGRVRRAVEPGALSAPHRGVPALADCSSCHDATGMPPDAKCVACHEDVAAGRAAGTGYHGKLAGACAGCHGEHRGAPLVSLDRTAFNHRQADFDLRGAHRDLACDACHRRTGPDGAGEERWQGIPHATCTDCHEDPHAGTLGTDCAKCHSESGFAGRDLRFSHRTDSGFPLVGAHANLDCAECHEAPAGGGPPDFAATPTGCADCHAGAHRTSFDRDCTACHGTEEWTGRGLRFRHDTDTSFPLTGRHRELACTRCHQPAPGGDLASADFAAASAACAACHESPHGPDLPASCADCHSTETFADAPRRIDHSGFPLTGAHAGVACAACHVPAAGAAPASATFRGLSTACADCHEDPHRGRFEGESCARCHSPTDWDRTTFDHDAVFAIDGNHRPLDCAACHGTKEFRVKSRSCEGCHEDVAADLAGAEGMPPDPHAGKVSCAECHDPSGSTRSLPAMAAACTKCHAESYARLLVDRTGRVNRALATLAASPDATEEERAEAARLARAASHDYVPAERRLSRLAAGGKEDE